MPILVTRDSDRRAARVPQRLPPSRRRAHRGLRRAQHDPVPLPRVDVRPRRLAAHRAALGTRARLRQRRVVAAPASVGTWGPFLFVNPDAGAAPLAEHLGDLPEILARDIDVDGLVFHSRVAFGANANWKIVVENFLECYHCATAHPALQRRGRRASRPLPARGAPDVRRAVLPGEDDGETRGSSTCSIPNTGINVFPGPANLSIGPIAPTGTDRTERYLDYFFAPDVDEAWLRDFFAFDDQVGREDTLLVESVHRGMASGLLEHGRLLVNAEPLLAAFQRWVERAARCLEAHAQASRRRARASRRAPRSRSARRAEPRSRITSPVTTGAASAVIGDSSSSRPCTRHVTSSDRAVTHRGDRERLQRARDRLRLRLDRLAVAFGRDPLVV